METVRYALISLQDLRLGTGKFEVTLADGRTVLLDEINLSTFISPLTKDLDADTFWIVDLGGLAVGTSDKTVAPANIGTQDTRTATVKVVGVFFATTTGVPAAGIGASIKLQAESTDESPSDLVELQGTFSDVGAGTENSDLRVLLRAAGAALAEKGRFVSTGALWLGTTAGAVSAILDLTSTTRGLLLPRLTTTQRDAVVSPTNGLAVYNTALDTLDVYAASAWQSLTFRVPEIMSQVGMGTNGADAANDIDFEGGTCTSEDAAHATRVLMTGGPSTKRLDAAWVVGTGQGGLDTGAVGNGTYHVFAIKRMDTGVVDRLFSLSATAPTLPANYTKQRRLGSILRLAGANLAFVQYTDEFWLSTPVLDVNATNPGTAAVTRALTVPSGYRVKAYLNTFANSAVGVQVVAFLVSSLDLPDVAPSITVAPLGSVLVGVTSPVGGIGQIGGQMQVWTDTSAQVRSRATASGGGEVYRVVTLGWMDRRGRG